MMVVNKMEKVVGRSHSSTGSPWKAKPSETRGSSQHWTTVKGEIWMLVKQRDEATTD